ncbi:hypothetical protein BS50DRAFT_5535 [Corynespora cassiicola Philippines]|uniref:Uncharacterized protein n=1 Tax=Corynespora cassiicola Philippines TaxID=1448308 RepID=A0A2T2P8L5_CORCC|nr:hypothetical protein BS50DRAFT_5535 [Corynespora cassiicola Philippines]
MISRSSNLLPIISITFLPALTAIKIYGHRRVAGIGWTTSQLIRLEHTREPLASAITESKAPGWMLKRRRKRGVTVKNKKEAIYFGKTAGEWVLRLPLVGTCLLVILGLDMRADMRYIIGVLVVAICCFVVVIRASKSS